MTAALTVTDTELDREISILVAVSSSFRSLRDEIRTHRRETRAEMQALGESPVVSRPRARTWRGPPEPPERSEPSTWNRSPTIVGESGTTRSSGTERAVTPSVRRARATPPFTNRTSFVSPSWFVLSRPRSRRRAGRARRRPPRTRARRRAGAGAQQSACAPLPTWSNPCSHMHRARLADAQS